MKTGLSVLEKQVPALKGVTVVDPSIKLYSDDAGFYVVVVIYGLLALVTLLAFV